MDKIIKDIQSRFAISDIVHIRDNMTFVTCEKQKTIALITHMKKNLGFKHFVLMTAVDWIEDGLFQLTYILNNPKQKLDVAVRTMISRDEATMESAHKLWKQVSTYQRELKEMFGINFPESPRIDESFILEGWNEIPPYRRDFQTKEYAEQTFFPRPGRETNDPSEYMKKNLK